MSTTTEAAIDDLVAVCPYLAPVLAEHLEDNSGEMLPHLVMADVVRWLVAHRNSDRDECASVLRWMEMKFEEGTDDVRGMIVVSGVEIIPDPGQAGSELRCLLGPSLRAFDPWS